MDADRLAGIGGHAQPERIGALALLQQPQDLRFARGQGVRGAVALGGERGDSPEQGAGDFLWAVNLAARRSLHGEQHVSDGGFARQVAGNAELSCQYGRFAGDVRFDDIGCRTRAVPPTWYVSALTAA